MKSKTIYFLDKFRKLSMHFRKIFLSDSSPVQRCNRFSVQYFVLVYFNLVQYLIFSFYLYHLLCNIFVQFSASLSYQHLCLFMEFYF